MNYELNKNIPLVRFPEFKDDWEQTRLGNLIYKTDKKNKENLNLPVYSINNPPTSAVFRQSLCVSTTCALLTQRHSLIKAFTQSITYYFPFALSK